MAQEAPPATPGLRLAKSENPPGAPAHAAPGDHDALAELFLGPGARGSAPAIPGRTDQSTTTERSESRGVGALEQRPAHVEGLILGHLPVMGSAWAMQYARELAAQRRAGVGVLRVRGDEVSIEVVGGSACPLAAPAATLDEGLQRAVRTARQWLVRIDGPGEAQLAEHAGLDSITLLSGADQAAVVGAFGSIKQLFPEARKQEQVAPVRVVIVGSADERTAEARIALARAAEAFLAREVEVFSGPQRIGGGAAPAALVYRGAAPPLDLLLEKLRQSLACAKPEPRPSPTTIEPPVDPGRGELDRHLVRVMEQAVAEAGNVRSAASPAPATLAPHLGFSTLAARCPYVPGVELAADTDGHLHLLAQAKRGEDPVRGLLSAAAWATAHSQLLQLAAPTLRHIAPVLHIFVSDARTARDLQETGVRLHLLAPVQLGPETAWFCGALN